MNGQDDPYLADGLIAGGYGVLNSSYWALKT